VCRAQMLPVVNTTVNVCVYLYVCESNHCKTSYG